MFHKQKCGSTQSSFQVSRDQKLRLIGKSCSKQCLTLGLKIINLVSHSSFMDSHFLMDRIIHLSLHSHTARLLTMSMKCVEQSASLFWLWIAHTDRKSVSDRNEKWSITVFTSAKLPLSESQMQVVGYPARYFLPTDFWKLRTLTNHFIRYTLRPVL